MISITVDFTEKSCGINQPQLFLSFKNIYRLRVPAPILPRDHRLFIAIRNKKGIFNAAAISTY
jgi:hypothetical protein